MAFVVVSVCFVKHLELLGTQHTCSMGPWEYYHYMLVCTGESLLWDSFT